MLKKIMLGILFTGFSAVLIVGAINRTNSKVTQLEEGGSAVRGQANLDRVSSESDSRSGVGQNGDGRNRTAERSAQVNPEPLVSARVIEQDQITVTAKVFDVNESVLTLEQEDGVQMAIEGRAWRFALESGFTTEAGHIVTVNGFHEDGEFKPTSLEDLSSGGSIVLRSDSGQPMWSGGGRGRSKG